MQSPGVKFHLPWCGTFCVSCLKGQVGASHGWRLSAVRCYKLLSRKEEAQDSSHHASRKSEKQKDLSCWHITLKWFRFNNCS